MRHKWTYNNSKFNFCVKCGMKKVSAYGRSCNVSTTNWKLKLNHDLKDYVHPYKEYRTYNPIKDKKYLEGQGFSSFRHECKKCKIHNNRHYMYAIHWKGNEAFVPYVTVLDEFGKKEYKCITSNKKPKKYESLEVKFWPIYCAYTDNEMDVMDIII